MNFYIKQGSNHPYLTVELLENGISNNSKTFYEDLENSEITFFMEELSSCIPVIQCGECCLIENTDCDDCKTKLYIQYKWLDGETSKKGKYEGWFEILFKSTNTLLKAPIKEKLFINIL